MRFPKERSVTSLSSTTVPCLWQTHAVARPRNLVDLVPDLATRSLTVNFPFALSWSSIKCINLMELVLVIFVWIEWSVPTFLCLEDNWVIWYPDLFLRQEVWVEVGGWGRGGECPWVEGLLQLGCYSSQLCVVGTMGMHIPVFTQGKQLWSFFLCLHHLRPLSPHWRPFFVRIKKHVLQPLKSNFILILN